MRAMPIRIINGEGGWKQMHASFSKNYKHYLQEAMGLAIFMISACFFGAILEASNSPVHAALPDSAARTTLMGVAMGATALLIFYSSFTAPSGSHINPAVTLTFFYLGKMCPWDTFFYIIFQFVGGTLSVYLMQLLLGSWLVNAPVLSVVTIPGEAGTMAALITEVIIAFATMIMVLITSSHNKLKKFTRIFAACLVCTWVMIAGPISGFGMNPARSFASALPAGIWSAFWIYLLAPITGMLLAAVSYKHFTRIPDTIKSMFKRRKESEVQV